MKCHFLPICLAALLATGLCRGAGDCSRLAPGPVPETQVFDPCGLIVLPVRQQIESALAATRKREMVDVRVVVMPSLEGGAPEVMAARYGRAWGAEAAWAVVLHVPSEPGSPWIATGGQVPGFLEPESLKRSVDNVVRIARYEPDSDSRVRMASEGISDLLRYLSHKTDHIMEMLRAERMKIQLEQENNSRHWRLAVIGVCGGMAVGVALFAVLWLRWLRARRYVFPETEWQRRFGAPHAGGNDASVRLEQT